MFKLWPIFLLGLTIGYIISFFTFLQLILGIVYVVVVIVILFLGFFLFTYFQLYFTDPVISDIKSIRFTDIGSNKYEIRVESLYFDYFTIDKNMKNIFENVKKHEVAYFYDKFDDFVLKKSIINQIHLTYSFMLMYLREFMYK